MFAALINRFHRRASAPPMPPAHPLGFVPVLTSQPDDHHHHDDGEVIEADIYGQSFGMIYRSANGEETQRRITVRALAFSLEGALIVKAFCWERGAPRTFRADRIQTLYRLSTGEIIPTPATFFAAYANEHRYASADSTDILLKETAPGIRALLFISRSDADESMDEREAIRWYVEQRANGRAFVWDRFSRFLDHQSPDTHLVARGLGQISKDRRHARCLLDAAARLIDADGEITAEETAACVELQQILHQYGEAA